MHLLACAACQGELDFLRLLVGGLRSLPAPTPPSDFSARVLARWRDERDSPVAPELVAEVGADVPAPTAAAGPVASLAAAAPAAVPATLRPVPAAPPHGWPPPSQGAAVRPARSAFQPFYALVAAMFALIFGVGLLTGKSYYGPADVKSAGVVPNLREVADQFKQAVDLRVGSTATPADAAAVAVTECAGRPNEWNPTQLQMVVRPPLHPVVNGQAEVAVWVPDNVRVAFDANEYSAGQLLLIPARVAENGEWQASLQWRALRPGRFDAWVETRCGGLYLHRPIVFHAITP